MRHSVVDPTKMGLSSVHFDDQHLSDVGDSSDEPQPLESLTKFRPKQTNKRPPSTHFRSSKVVSFMHFLLFENYVLEKNSCSSNKMQMNIKNWCFYEPQHKSGVRMIRYANRGRIFLQLMVLVDSRAGK